jgi:REP element-mobilizing transposase RayT
MSSAMAHGLTGDVCMNLSDFGKIVRDEWHRSASIRPAMELDAFVVMPNHVHGIIIITEELTHGCAEKRAHGCAPLQQPYGFNRKPRSLGSFIAGFKSTATKRINIIRGTVGVPVWQRNYYERVIRSEAELHAIRQYIADNPRRWNLDRENPRNL